MREHIVTKGEAERRAQVLAGALVELCGLTDALADSMHRVVIAADHLMIGLMAEDRYRKESEEKTSDKKDDVP